MRRFIVVFKDRSVEKSKAIWAKSPAQAEKAFKILFPNAGVIGVIED